jgi:prepilin-type N-terminal cleavage/methylation domain-containing protein/prepilin-type processing-associated H-X9-DG protein
MPTRTPVRSRPAQTAFTLVELLVVISIIVILLALLVPGLEKAMASSQKSACGTNLSAIGKACATYLNDSISRSWPKTDGPNGNGWFMLFGKLGTLPNYSTPTSMSPASRDPLQNQDVQGRPLNHYLGYMSNGADVKVAQCKSDAGVSLAVDNDNNDVWDTTNPPITNCYNQLGSSYITPYKKRSGIEAAFGLNPMQASAAKPPSSKVLAADAPLYADNQWAADRKNRWHSSDKTRREMNVLFADSHVDFTFFKNDAMGKPEIESSTTTTTPMPARGYW